MKIRTGFVSNSSSSSFIIAVRVSEVCPHCGRSDPDLLQLLANISNEGYDDETRLRCRGRSAVLAYLEEGLRDDGIDPKDVPDQMDAWELDKLEQYLEIQRQDFSGWELAAISISYHNQTLNTLLKQSSATGTVRILVDNS